MAEFSPVEIEEIRPHFDQVSWFICKAVKDNVFLDAMQSWMLVHAVVVCVSVWRYLAFGMRNATIGIHAVCVCMTYVTVHTIKPVAPVHFGISVPTHTRGTTPTPTPTVWWCWRKRTYHIHRNWHVDVITGGSCTCLQDSRNDKRDGPGWKRNLWISRISCGKASVQIKSLTLPNAWGPFSYYMNMHVTV